MLLNTVVVDVYASDERFELHTALDDLTSANDFSPNGVYCFWDPATREVLYVGLSVNLAARFKQHNSRSRKKSSGCKRKQINEWFDIHDHLGYSVVLQSAIGTGGEAVGAMGLGEGQLIEAHRLARGNKPKWNAMNGSTRGAAEATAQTRGWFDLLTSVEPSLQVARRTIRQLSRDDVAFMHEVNLWSARMTASLNNIVDGVDSQAIVHAVRAFDRLSLVGQNGHDQLLSSGYLLEPQPFLNEKR